MSETNEEHIEEVNKPSTPKVAVLYHIFYEDSVTHIVDELKGLGCFQTSFFFNICSDTPNQHKIREALLMYFPGAFICTSSNKGKDIGGKLLLIKVCLQLQYKPDWIIFLHDKKSLQALNAKTWKNDLLKIIQEDQLQKINEIISNNSKLGIIAAKNYVRKETKEDGKFTGNNGPILDELIQKYNITSKNHEYVAGTMFWAKASVLIDFFKKFDPLKIRQTLEEGNVIDNFNGTNTHAWERILSWIITNGGLNFKTI
ncbi:rhamnan synthesis F family protein [Niastella sp. OAS944]|uniref:rhamnan synthesis F family protein n=1 Tax=Niastella sp. OAS944 TaxID=2664089 RepID=UPI0034876B36|nr:lipopolysaccharide biosynthesis protein [Chitinophagaceae bacterium OAS944]